ncbi:Phytochrome-like protein cph1 [Anaerohalosphaera lusitana]|uniref:histidine kinase n=1 Tax=Anaerohalosphaera lusitana TaxID=1936003 RepID=A0A1U9NGR1_9BACT|nr:ATP-binding protein [Anaerohalosphaera lusitana]AQT67123.1 Phytochrome-like protein cph1 [Anaerohalosphaera lusitana]
MSEQCDRKSWEELREKILGLGERSTRKSYYPELRRRLDELRSKNAELESILYVTSHDLKSPLVNLKGFGEELKDNCERYHEILEELQLEGEQAEEAAQLRENVELSLHYIDASVQKIDMLLNGLLRLSRLGKVELVWQQIEPKDIVNDILESMRYQLREAGAQIHVEDLPSCWGDAEQVNHVFSNLIDNALKYCHPERKAEIEIAGENCGAECLYRVSDNGVGISEKNRERVFEIFHRLIPDHASRGEGLGLSIVKRIMQRHGGKVWVESEEGAGSTFYLTFPAYGP